MAGNNKPLLKSVKRNFKLTPQVDSYLEETVRLLKEHGVKDITVTKLLTEGGVKEAQRLRKRYDLPT